MLLRSKLDSISTRETVALSVCYNSVQFAAMNILSAARNHQDGMKIVLRHLDAASKEISYTEVRSSDLKKYMRPTMENSLVDLIVIGQRDVHRLRDSNQYLSL